MIGRALRIGLCSRSTSQCVKSTSALKSSTWSLAGMSVGLHGQSKRMFHSNESSKVFEDLPNVVFAYDSVDNARVLKPYEDEELEFDYEVPEGPLLAPVYRLEDGKMTQTGEIELNRNVFGVPVRRDLIHLTNRWHEGNHRGITKHSAKTRGEVNATTRKPHPQKGTGRARQGSKVAPHMKGGGVAHPPKPKDMRFKVNKKVRRFALRSMLTARFCENSLHILDMNPEEEFQWQNANDDSVQSGPNVWNAETLRLTLENAEMIRSLWVDTVDTHDFASAFKEVSMTRFATTQHVAVRTIMLFDELVITKRALEGLTSRLDEKERRKVWY